MSPTDESSNDKNVEPTVILHLVTPSSQGKPLCGETSPDAQIGAYTEHLDDRGEWSREVFGRNGKQGPPCQVCLSLYPSMFCGDANNLRVLTEIAPSPRNHVLNYQLKATCLSPDFVIRSLYRSSSDYGDKVAITFSTTVERRKPTPNALKGR